MTTLRPHQARFIDDNPDKALLCWEMRTGKTLPASVWGERRAKKGQVIVVCPKQLINDWKSSAPYAMVLSKEQFKKLWQTFGKTSAIIVDEAHMFGAALFKKSRSELATALYNFIRKDEDMDVLLLSATPIRNDPSSLHTLLCYIGHYIPWKEWQKEFYEKRAERWLPRPKWMKNPNQVPMAWFPRNDWRIRIRKYLEKYADIVSLKDCVDFLPPVTPLIITKEVKPSKFVPPKDVEYRWTDVHQHEQTNKLAFIKSLGYRKIIVVCRYSAQIDDFKRELSKEREVFVLDGRMTLKQQDEAKAAAQAADECYFIVQAAMGFGFDGYMFGALVFASMSHTALDHTQMTGRMTSVDHPKPIFMYYLIGGKWDQRIYDSIILNQDFNPHKYLNEPLT